mmetsp:Transcript_51111/g.79872  ORF Transcript_51111/g.79872 Transcript_51111/m.79872 type:complete len:405 (-) Transcript_51111:53-1267(-)
MRNSKHFYIDSHGLAGPSYNRVNKVALSLSDFLVEKSGLLSPPTEYCEVQTLLPLRMLQHRTSGIRVLRHAFQLFPAMSGDVTMHYFYCHQRDVSPFTRLDELFVDMVCADSAVCADRSPDELDGAGGSMLNALKRMQGKNIICLPVILPSGVAFDTALQVIEASLTEHLPHRLVHKMPLEADQRAFAVGDKVMDKETVEKGIGIVKGYKRDGTLVVRFLDGEQWEMFPEDLMAAEAMRCRSQSSSSSSTRSPASSCSESDETPGKTKRRISTSRVHRNGQRRNHHEDERQRNHYKGQASWDDERQRKKCLEESDEHAQSTLSQYRASLTNFLAKVGGRREVEFEEHKSMVDEELASHSLGSRRAAWKEMMKLWHPDKNMCGNGIADAAQAERMTHHLLSKHRA